MHARPLLSLSALALCLAAVALPAADKPAPAADKVLRLFIDEFIPLTPGKDKFPASFEMGSSAAGAPASEKPVVTVRFKAPFALAKYEVTQELYQVVAGVNPSRWKGPRNSVEMVCWIDANTFCTKVTDLLHKNKLLAAGEVIRLPSEAEWEYACRAGTKTAYSFGDKADDLGAHAWFSKNSKGEDPPVGRKKPNAWGLYDMHGYVSEWCADAWRASYKGAPTDGSPWTDAEQKDRVIRGGSFADPADSLRCAFRDHKPMTARSDRIGFRCVKAGAPPGPGRTANDPFLHANAAGDRADAGLPGRRLAATARAGAERRLGRERPDRHMAEIGPHGRVAARRGYRLCWPGRRRRPADPVPSRGRRGPGRGTRCIDRQGAMEVPLFHRLRGRLRQGQWSALDSGRRWRQGVYAGGGGTVALPGIEVGQEGVECGVAQGVHGEEELLRRRHDVRWWRASCSW